MQAKKFLGGQDWIRARTALYDFYNRDALAQQRRCIIPQQVYPLRGHALPKFAQDLRLKRRWRCHGPCT